jgi:glycosyltransferase involved in cell wall biosynthesis
MQTVRPHKILVIGSVPPPSHGCNVFIKHLLNSELLRKFRIIHLDTSDRRSIDNIGNWDSRNVMLAIKHLTRLVALCIKHRPALAYLSIAQNNPGYLRDGLFIILIAIFSKARTIIQLHGSYFREFYESTNWMMRRLVDVSMRFVARAIVLSESLRPVFHRWLPDSRIDVVPNGSPMLPYLNGKFDRSNERELQVIYLGNLLKFKGVLDIAIAAELVLKKHPRIKFRFAGNWGYDPVYHQSAGSVHDECMAHIRQSGMADRFEFVGELKGRELENYLVDGDLFVFPSMVEGMPLVILEAMAAGNPVISTKEVGAIPDIVRHGETGILVEKQNPEALASAIIELIDDPQKRHRMGAAGRRRFEQHYTKKKNIDNLIRVFEKTLNGYSDQPQSRRAIE